MAEANVQTTEPTDDVTIDEPVADEVLVEEISIDGMCGVY
jgi:mycofactocin precursor